MSSHSSAQTRNIDPAQDPSSPYYIHPSDSQYKLVPTIFYGSAYNDWKRSVMIGLSAKNKLGFIDGSIPKPLDNVVLAKAWERCNNTVISWFIQVLHPIIARSILYFDTAREVWRNLEERFGQTLGTQIYSIPQQISELEQGNDSISEDEHLTHFLMKLNSDYKIVRDSLLLQQPLPTISHAYRLLMHTKRIMSSQSHNQQTALWSLLLIKKESLLNIIKETISYVITARCQDTLRTSVESYMDIHQTSTLIRRAKEQQLCKESWQTQRLLRTIFILILL
ncbi:Retrovirus-related Pol polyprotein from transposon RE1 [Bienertia sinuspersici]